MLGTAGPLLSSPGPRAARWVETNRAARVGGGAAGAAVVPFVAPGGASVSPLSGGSGGPCGAVDRRLQDIGPVTGASARRRGTTGRKDGGNTAKVHFINANKLLFVHRGKHCLQD